MEQGPMAKMYWRKSAQWSSLIRKHAQLVADDMAVADIFAKYCRVGTDKKTGKQHTCISDEVRPRRSHFVLTRASTPQEICAEVALSQAACTQRCQGH